ncbi:hypothetical protein L3Q82_019354 [Scortum barcoo]|uniref:Uncharacterized protein n=1 Tax=Scortum barcoo TaxID=214431 RepID=A0ACB8VBM4_9TELE|nr:hypothetical protein L3Q82_019354 [Scortum barcoo]
MWPQSLLLSSSAPSTHADMQKYWWPGYEIQLLGELQRQQNNAQFCDTLLQTEGISVPTHSCILAALSPYLSQKLSTSPSPPSGQKRLLKLQAVKAQTLLKLVGLLYSGELEVKGSTEQDDVLSAARQFGITDLLEGQKAAGLKEGEPQRKRFRSYREEEEERDSRERNESRKMQDAQVQAEMAVSRDTVSPVEKRSCVSTGTQTVKAGEKTEGCSFTHSCQTEPPTPEPASSVAQSLDFSVSLQPQSITLERHARSASLPPVPSMPSSTPSHGESILDRSLDSLTNPKSASSLFINTVTFPLFPYDSSNSPTLQGNSTSSQQSSEYEDCAEILAKEGSLEEGKMADSGENTKQPSHRDEMLGEEEGNFIEKRHAHANVRTKSMAKMRQMQQAMDTTQISIKVKLRRRTKGEVWEVVSVHDTDETLSVLTSLKQDGFNHRRPRADLTDGEPPPSFVQPGPAHKPEILILQPAVTNFPEATPQTSTTSDSQPLSGDSLTPPHQSPGRVEESDEQIEKLLEDIMMGLNILPSLERDCKKSHHLQPSSDGVLTICRVPAADCVYYQDFGAQSSEHLINRYSLPTCCTSIHSCFTAQPSCSSFSFVQPDAVLIQQQEQPSVTEQSDGTRQQSMPLSQSPNRPHSVAPTARLVIPTTFYSSEQCQGLASQVDQNILEFLPLANGNEAEPSHSFCLPFMADMQLPRCLSPLEPSTTAATDQPMLTNTTNHSDKIQPPPTLHYRPWLTENARSLQFPLCVIRENKHASLPQDTERSCLSKQQHKCLDFTPQNGGTWAESHTVRQVKERGAVSAADHSTAVFKSDPRKVKENSRCEQGDSKKRKKKHTSHQQGAVGSLLAHKDVTVSDGTKSQVNLSVCSVSLSSNNVLAKEREMATSSSNVTNKFVGKPSELSTLSERLKGTRASGDVNSDRTPIRTRGFIKQKQDTQTNTRLERVCRAEIADKVEVSQRRRKRGRPPKRKPVETPAESSSAIMETLSHDAEREQQIDNNLPTEEEDEKTKTCKKQRRNISEVEAKTKSLESPGKVEGGANNDITSAGRKLETVRPVMVSLKEFQKLIKCQHSKTRKSRKGLDKEASETARDGESEGKACGSKVEELTKETITDTAENKDGDEEPHIIFNTVTLDQNHNQIFNKSTAEYSKSQQDNTNSFTSKKTDVFNDEHQPVFSIDVLGEETDKLAAEKEQLWKNPDEGVSDPARHIVDSSPLCCYTQLLHAGDEHTLNPQTPERTGSNSIERCLKVTEEAAGRFVVSCPQQRVTWTAGWRSEQRRGANMDPMKAQQLAAELEVEMMADMYNRMTNACHRKCVPPHYKEAELTKVGDEMFDGSLEDSVEHLVQRQHEDNSGPPASLDVSDQFYIQLDPGPQEVTWKLAGKQKGLGHVETLFNVVRAGNMMEASDEEDLVREADQLVAPPHGGINELLNVGQEDNMQGQMEEFLGPQAEYNEEEEERKYYRRKRLGVIRNVLAASVGAMIVYSVYMGLLQMQLVLHYDMTYREVKYSNLGLEDIDRKMLMGINVTPIISLLYSPILIRFLGTKWMMFLASGIYALFVSTNYWERYYTLVPSAVAIGVAIVPFWASLGNYMTRMAQQYYEYVNYKEEHVQEQKKLPKGACHSYIIVFQSVFSIIFHLSFVFAEFPMRFVLNSSLHDNEHILCNVKSCGATVSGVIPGFNTTVLTKLPRSMLLIQVESVLMGLAFLAMIIFLVLCGPAYRPTEEIDLRSIGWGNIFQLPFKHLRDYRLRLLCPFFVYSGFEVLFAVTGFSLSYGVCLLGLKNLWLLIVVYGLSCSIFSSLSLCLLRLPRWLCLAGGAVVHVVLLVALLSFSVQMESEPTKTCLTSKGPVYLGPLLAISVLWGLGTALNKTGVSTLLGMLYAEEKERLDFVYTIYHWWQAIAIFIVYLWSNLPMRAKLSMLLATLLLACYCYWVMERRLAMKVPYRLPRIPRPRHKVKGYRYLEEDNSDESDSERSEDDDEEDRKEDEEHVAEELGAEDGEERDQGTPARGADSPVARRRGAEGQRRRWEDAHVREGEREEREGG